MDDPARQLREARSVTRRHAGRDRRYAGRGAHGLCALGRTGIHTHVASEAAHGLRLLRLSGLHVPDSLRRAGRPVARGAHETLIEAAGLPARLDPERGFDHGAFTPLKVIYPQANVPVVQLSLKAGLDPEAHLALGRAIAPLRDEDVLIVGSGLSYHNLRQFFSPRGWGPSREFDGWLGGVLLGGSPMDRDKLLAAWEAAPAARAAHPREEHLLPLMVAAGAAGNDPAERTYHETDFLGGLTVSSYCFSKFTAS